MIATGLHEPELSDLKVEFLADARQRLATIEAATARADRRVPEPSLIEMIHRTLHTLHGTAGLFELDDIANHAGSAESLAKTMQTNRHLAVAMFPLVLSLLSRIRRCLDAEAAKMT